MFLLLSQRLLLLLPLYTNTTIVFSNILSSHVAALMLIFLSDYVSACPEPMVYMSAQYLYMCESADFFWETFLEMMHVLRPGGFLYLNVPSKAPVHRYPVIK
jgi:hypothetical protein